MKTAPQDREHQQGEENAQPVTSFTRIIELTPGAGSFSGWGPRVSDATLITRFN